MFISPVPETKQLKTSLLHLLLNFLHMTYPRSANNIFRKREKNDKKKRQGGEKETVREGGKKERKRRKRKVNMRIYIDDKPKEFYCCLSPLSGHTSTLIAILMIDIMC